MKDSIMQKEKRCYLCGRQFGLERHHVMAGVANRKISDKYGIWVYLCHNCHTGVDGAQYSREKGDALKREAQEAFEALYSHEKWMDLFRKNYL